MFSINRLIRSQKGFTLIELVVVIAIIGILVTIAVPAYNASQDNAKVAKIRADLRTIDSAHMIYIANGNAALAKDSTAAQMTTALVPNYLTSFPAVPNGFGGAYTIGNNNRAAYLKAGGAYEYADAASFTK